MSYIYTHAASRRLFLLHSAWHTVSKSHPTTSSAGHLCIYFCSREDVARVLAGALQAPPAQGLVFQVCTLLHQLQLHK